MDERQTVMAGSRRAIPKPAKQKRIAAIGVRLGGVPLYAAILLQGMPLDRHLGFARSAVHHQAQRELVDRVTTVGVTQSLLPAAVWGAIYLYSLFLLTQRSSRTALRQMLSGQWPIIGLVVFSVLGVLWSPYAGKVLASSFHAAGITAIAMAAAMRWSSNSSSFMARLSICFAGNLLVHLAAIIFVPAIAIASDGRWMGLAPHSNSLGEISMLGAWAAATALLLFRGGRKLILFPFGISLLALYGSGSMTSMVSAALAISLSVVFSLSLAWPRSLRQLVIVAAFCGFASLAVVAASINSFVGGITAELGKSSDFTGRGIIWQEAWRLIGEHPILGWGFDDNARVIVQTGFIHTGYHNGYLDLAVRGGVVAMLLLLFVLVRWVRDISRSSRVWMSICIPFVGVVLLHNFMEVSLFSARNPIWLIFLAIAFCTTLLVRSGAPSRSIKGAEMLAPGLMRRNNLDPERPF